MSLRCTVSVSADVWSRFAHLLFIVSKGIKKKKATQKVTQALIAVYNEMNHKILHYSFECPDYFKVNVDMKNLKYVCFLSTLALTNHVDCFGVSCRVLEISSPFSNISDSENKRHMKSSTAACLSRKRDPVAQDNPQTLL